MKSRTKKDAFIRLFSALIPGFVFTNTFGVLVTLALPGETLDNLSFVITFAFLFYSFLVMWIFHTEKKSTIAWVLGSGIALSSFAAYAIYTVVHWG